MRAVTESEPHRSCLECARKSLWNGTVTPSHSMLDIHAANVPALFPLLSHFTQTMHLLHQVTSVEVQLSYAHTGASTAFALPMSGAGLAPMGDASILVAGYQVNTLLGINYTLVMSSASAGQDATPAMTDISLHVTAAGARMWLAIIQQLVHLLSSLCVSLVIVHVHAQPRMQCGECAVPAHGIPAVPREVSAVTRLCSRFAPLVWCN